MNRWLAVGAVFGALSGCGYAPEGPSKKAVEFEVGEANDPIVQAEAAIASTDTVTITLKNVTGYNFTQGLVLFSVPFTVNGAASAPFSKFVSGSSASRGDATALATGLGLTVGTSAFVVPALAKNGGQTMVTIQAPIGSKVTYVTRVDSSIDDFVAALDVPLTGLAPGPVNALIQGYDLADPTKISVGNGTTGQRLGNTTFVINNVSDCPGGAWAATQNLLSDDFAAGANSKTWPAGAGWDGEFNGDWYTDGITVRVYNPNWGGADPNAQTNIITGFHKRLDVCPATGALLQVDAKVVTQLSDSTSDTTLVVYFFDRAGALLSVATNWPLYDQNDRTTTVRDTVIPTGTRRVVIAPMMRLGAAEQGAVYYDRISVDYEPSTTFTNTTLASDDFSSLSNGTYGSKQPKGWAEFGGDWYGLSPQGWATLGNPAWAARPTNVDTGMTKVFSLSSFGSADVISAKVFAAATFTDPTSFVRLRLVFNGGTALESQRQVRGWGNLEVHRQPVPSGTKSVTVIVNAFLGPNETSSLYIDNFSMVKSHRN